MDTEELRRLGHQAVDWVADYFESLEDLPVKSQVQPGDISRQLPNFPPDGPEPLADALSDLNDILLPGMTH